MEFRSLPEGYSLSLTTGLAQAKIRIPDDQPTSTFEAATEAFEIAEDADTFLADRWTTASEHLQAVGDSSFFAPVAHNVWSTTDSLTIDRTSVEATIWMSWVRVGWLLEVRLTSTDGQYNDHKWLSGGIQNSPVSGSWDEYDADGELIGVHEWYEYDDETRLLVSIQKQRFFSLWFEASISLYLQNSLTARQCQHPLQTTAEQLDCVENTRAEELLSTSPPEPEAIDPSREDCMPRQTTEHSVESRQSRSSCTGPY